ncbi:DinB family protein [Limnochorda pilosa]|uniref:DinB-like domain-containing protein n=1 Tax=Limnochorda pilosa TaxID=1555112 RepID=A0A0K2SIU5_LIMPI|nr:DinB family protein [Limnochorda pilosa]BAS26947.1 hypothetical protein LIP_1090 [Limnochorda pilosa]
MEGVVLIRNGLDASRSTLLRILRGGATDGAIPEVPRDPLRWRPAPGSHSVGELLWHVADVEDKWVTERVLGQSYRPRYQTRPFDPEAVLPPWTDLIRYLEESRAQTLDALEKMGEPALNRPVEFLRRTTTLGQVYTTLIHHEGYHTGQIAHILGLIRRAGW